MTNTIEVADGVVSDNDSVYIIFPNRVCKARIRMVDNSYWQITDLEDEKLREMYQHAIFKTSMAMLRQVFKDEKKAIMYHKLKRS